MLEIRSLVVGNWKMNGINSSLSELSAIASGVEAMKNHFDVVLCLPSTLLSRAVDVARQRLFLGGQDCHGDECGAHTGDISAMMLKDAGATYSIIGHSERRISYRETDSCIRKKVAAAWKVGLKTIVCIGETIKERECGKTIEIIIRQCQDSLPDKVVIENLIIAYEPIWAIGSGNIPTNHDIVKVYAALRDILCHRFGYQRGSKIILLYGGSVKSANAKHLIAIKNINGVLIGGASLKSKDFLAICRVYDEM